MDRNLRNGIAIILIFTIINLLIFAILIPSQEFDVPTTYTIQNENINASFNQSIRTEPVKNDLLFPDTRELVDAESFESGYDSGLYLSHDNSKKVEGTASLRMIGSPECPSIILHPSIGASTLEANKTIDFTFKILVSMKNSKPNYVQSFVVFEMNSSGNIIELICNIAGDSAMNSGIYTTMHDYIEINVGKNINANANRWNAISITDLRSLAMTANMAKSNISAFTPENEIKIDRIQFYCYNDNITDDFITVWLDEGLFLKSRFIGMDCLWQDSNFKSHTFGNIIQFYSIVTDYAISFEKNIFNFNELDGFNQSEFIITIQSFGILSAIDEIGSFSYGNAIFIIDMHDAWEQGDIYNFEIVQINGSDYWKIQGSLTSDHYILPYQGLWGSNLKLTYSSNYSINAIIAGGGWSNVSTSDLKLITQEIQISKYSVISIPSFIVWFMDFRHYIIIIIGFTGIVIFFGGVKMKRDRSIDCTLPQNKGKKQCIIKNK